jgi:N-acetylglucosamine kinase-like BadF-type ATPase
LLLGVDGGGTKTAAWLGSFHPHNGTRVIGRGTAGAANPSDLGLDAAQAAIQLAVGNAFDDAGIPPVNVCAGVLAIAGAAGEVPKNSLKHWAIESRLAMTMAVVADAEPILAEGTPDGWGIALIAGTGSFVYGVNPSGDIASAGGYGYLVGDEGSGFWLGKQALAAVVKQLEGNGPTTALARVIAAHDATANATADATADATTLKQAVYRHGATRQSIAALAPLVARTAELGDSVAAGILATGAKELAMLVRNVASALGLAEGPFPLAMGGGVLVHSTMMRDHLDQQLIAMGLNPVPTNVVADPVAGCLQLAEALHLNK